MAVARPSSVVSPFGSESFPIAPTATPLLIPASTSSNSSRGTALTMSMSPVGSPTLRFSPAPRSTHPSAIFTR